MNHYITAGFFDAQLIRRGKLVKTGDLDPEVVHELLRSYTIIGLSGRHMVGGLQLFYQDGYIKCPGLVPYALPDAIELLRMLHERTRCMLVDIGCREIIDVLDLLPEITNPPDTAM
jgi:hypothetical protein